MPDFISRMQAKGIDFDLAVTLSECCDEHAGPGPLCKDVAQV